MCEDFLRAGHARMLVDPGVRQAYFPETARKLYTDQVRILQCVIFQFVISQSVRPSPAAAALAVHAAALGAGQRIIGQGPPGPPSWRLGSAAHDLAHPNHTGLFVGTRTYLWSVQTWDAFKAQMFQCAQLSMHACMPRR